MLFPALPSAFSQLRINEILAVNSTVTHDPDFGEFSDFVELHNATASPVNLKDYSLTDDAGNYGKWLFPELILPPQGYFVIWTDDHDKRPGDTAFIPHKNSVQTITGLHANFRLSGDGEYIGLFDPQGSLVDERSYCTQANDVSYGRSPIMPSEWLYFGEATPNAANSAYGSALMETAAEPVFSLSEGFYPGEKMLHIGSPEPGGVVRFTFDGSAPNAESPMFTDSFLLHRNYVVKARLYVPGKMPGKVVTKTYFIGENIQLPVISISANVGQLFGFDFGILQNAIKDREVPATIEYFEPMGGRAFHTGVGVRVFGSTIYNLPQRPLSIRFRAKYGDETLNYPLFEGKPITAYSSFLLRNGGNDYNLAYFRDGLATNLVKGKMDLDYQDYKPCVLFVNGEYHGIYEIRERLDEQYIAANHEINDANLDYLEDSLAVAAGDAFDFSNLLKFITENDLAQPGNYAKVAERIDINEFINYMINRVFIGYQIADLNNRYWRDRDTQGKWRWIAADMEHAFGQLGGDVYPDNTLEKLAGLAGNLPEWATLLFNRLLQNKAFQDEFIQRSAVYLNSIYQPSATLALVDSLKALLEPEMPRHIGRWASPSSMALWHGNVNFIKTFLQNRPPYLRQHITQAFGKPDSALVTLHIQGQGKVQFSGVLIEEDMAGYFFKNAGISLLAIPAPGHRFVAWQGLNSTSETTAVSPLSDTAFAAVFEPLPISVIPPVIDADTALSAALSPWYGLEDVTILPGARLTVEAGAELLLTDKVSFIVQGGLHLKGQAGQRVILRSDPSPAARKSFYGQSNHWGAIIATNATDSIIIEYTDISGGSFGPDRAKYFATVSTYGSHLRIEHTTIANGKMPLFAQGGSMYIGHSEFHTPISCNGFISLHNLNTPVVEHCVFRGNRANDTDAIDLKGVTNGIIRYNHIYGFFGSNCDGIDLGIYSLNNLLEHNIIHDCTDKGISIGSQSNALIRRNLIYDCGLGVAVKDSLAVAFIDQNTFFGNTHAIACYEKSALRGGGKANVKNSILASSIASSLLLDEKSEANISYSISDTEALPGTGNIHADPAFIHPSTGNFQLQAASPCINSGDPFSPNDPDGSRADMGAYYTHTGGSGLTVHINELSYHPPFNRQTGDWLELYNRTGAAVDLSNWKIAHGAFFFIIEQNSVIGPGEYLAICQDTSLFKAFHPNISKMVGNLNFEFSNKSGKIALYRPDGSLAHSVRYADTRPWPPLADGLGATVELGHQLEGNIATDWGESYMLLGTPAATNSLPPDFSGLFINEIMASNATTIADEYGEFDDWFELYNATSDTMNIGGLCFTDDEGEPFKAQVPLLYPEKTILPPKGFLMLWADGQDGQGPLHLDFRLSASGETLGVYQRQENSYAAVDEVSFGDQNTGITWGRYPDGSASLFFMYPTPGSSNMLTGTKDIKTEALKIYPNPFTQWLHIEAKQIEKPYRWQLVNMMGQTAWDSGDTWQETFLFERGQVSSGIYTIQLTDAKGNLYIGKVVAQ